MTWWRRDPDMGRDRPTNALGRRDWSWFAAYDDSSSAPADLEAATAPWAGHAFTKQDRHDRTLGIPPRDVSMWPRRQLVIPSDPGKARGRAPPARVARRDRLAEIIEELRRLPKPSSPPNLPADLLASALADAAARVHARPTMTQYAVITEVARGHGLEPGELLRLARDVGEMIAKTTHRGAATSPGERSLNRLHGADLPLACRLYLARSWLTWAAAYSDPDLPRLWILANGLHHDVPAGLMFTQPARSRGLLAQITPTHDDLVGWHGMSAAVEHLDATVHAALEGRRWLAAAPDTVEHRLLGLGVLHLTHPASAHELVNAGAHRVPFEDLRALADRLPKLELVTDLSDEALKAVCDRNNWLLGTVDERTGRELVERHLSAAATNHVLARLAAGETTALGVSLARVAPSDEILDRAAWRRNPPALATVQRCELLGIASREALHRFAGLDLQPHPNKAAALAARFPNRLAEDGLRLPAHRLLAGVDASAPSPAGLDPRRPQQAELDLGL
jgi:hypothetical protein